MKGRVFMCWMKAGESWKSGVKGTQFWKFEKKWTPLVTVSKNWSLKKGMKNNQLGTSTLARSALEGFHWNLRVSNYVKILEILLNNCEFRFLPSNLYRLIGHHFIEMFERANLKGVSPKFPASVAAMCILGLKVHKRLQSRCD